MEKYFERIKGTDTTKNTNWPEANQLTTCKYGRGVELATIDNKSILIRRRPTVPQQITPLSPGKSRRGKGNPVLSSGENTNAFISVSPCNRA